MSARAEINDILNEMKTKTEQKQATAQKRNRLGMRRQIVTWGIAIVVFVALLSGCKMPFQPIPGVNRPGEYYYYTEAIAKPLFARLTRQAA